MSHHASAPISIRNATPEDGTKIHELVMDLARFEKLENEVEASRFDDRLGARPVDGWRRYRLTGPALSRLGATA